ncbi:Tyrosine kinase-like (TKL) protein, putative [Eimeria necatrix]|uniref:Tyrosine kinase-like (TKL) protein, putative n=1 Tax=Eimeria necatrix TaxID=51315 RepID=U6MHD6_9EIME|nr:Tyrosine kinase-like (TKL) protein, putative [Eimeria necatrix]CDJ63446.1 Tyrosine kinase-like (TKL) protein, putative [Eimeria necatrix]
MQQSQEQQQRQLLQQLLQQRQQQHLQQQQQQLQPMQQPYLLPSQQGFQDQSRGLLCTGQDERALEQQREGRRLPQQQHEQQQLLQQQQLQQHQQLDQQVLNPTTHHHSALSGVLNQEALPQEKQQQIHRLRCQQQRQYEQQQQSQQLHQQLPRHRLSRQSEKIASATREQSRDLVGRSQSSTELPVGLAAAVATAASPAAKTRDYAAISLAKTTTRAKRTNTKARKLPAAASMLLRRCLSKELVGPSLSDLALLPRLFHIFADDGSAQSSNNNSRSIWGTRDSSSSANNRIQSGNRSRQLNFETAEMFSRELLRCSVLRHPVSALKALIVAHRLLAQIPVDAFVGSSLHKLPVHILRIWSAKAFQPAAEVAASTAADAGGALARALTGTWSVSRFLRANGVSLETLVAFEAEGVVSLNASVALQLISVLHRACTLCLLLLQHRGSTLFAVSSIYVVLLVDDIWGIAALLLRLLHALLQRCMRPAVAAGAGLALVSVLASLANPLKEALKDMQIAAEECAAAASRCPLLQRMCPPPAETLLLLDDLRKQQQQQTSRMLLPRSQLLPYRPSSSARKSMQAVAQLPLPADLEAAAAAAASSGTGVARAASKNDKEWISFLKIEEVYLLLKDTTVEIALLLQEQPSYYASSHTHSRSSSNSSSRCSGISLRRHDDVQGRDGGATKSVDGARDGCSTPRAAASVAAAEPCHSCSKSECRGCAFAAAASKGADSVHEQQRNQRAQQGQRQGNRGVDEYAAGVLEAVTGAIDEEHAAAEAAPPAVQAGATTGSPTAFCAGGAAVAAAVTTQGSLAVASFDADLRSLTCGSPSFQEMLQQQTHLQQLHQTQQTHVQLQQQQVYPQHYFEQQQHLQQQQLYNQQLQQQVHQQEVLGEALQQQQLQQAREFLQRPQQWQPQQPWQLEQQQQHRQQQQQQWLHGNVGDSRSACVCQLQPQCSHQQELQKTQQLQRLLLEQSAMSHEGQLHQLHRHPLGQQERSLQHHQQLCLQQQLLLQLQQHQQPAPLQQPSYLLQCDQQPRSQQHYQQQYQQQVRQQQLQQLQHMQQIQQQPVAQTQPWCGALQQPTWPESTSTSTTAGVSSLRCSCVACRSSSGRSSCCLRDLKARLEALNLGVDPTELKINCRIGSGASGTVLKATWRGCDVAVKVLPILRQQALPQRQVVQQRDHTPVAAVAAAAAARELQIMKRLRCPNLVLLMGACALDDDAVCSRNSHRRTNDGSAAENASSARDLLATTGCQGPGLAVVMELCAGGSLFGLLHGRPEDALAAAAASPLKPVAAEPTIAAPADAPGSCAAIMGLNVSVDNSLFTTRDRASKAESAAAPATLPIPVATHRAPEGLKQPDSRQQLQLEQPQHDMQLLQQPEPQEEQQPHEKQQQRQRLTWAQKLKVALDVARGCAYLHASQPPVVHRDLKSLNILLVESITSDKQTPVAKVADFGLSRLATAASRGDDSAPGTAAAAAASTGLGGYSYRDVGTFAIRTRAVGTVHWMPPEVIRGLPQGPAVDVFAFGIVLYELAAETLPYLRPRDASSHQQRQQCEHNPQEADRENVWLPPPSEICAAVLRGERPDERFILPLCPPILRSLMRRCWAEDPWARPTFAEVVEELKAALEAT